MTALIEGSVKIEGLAQLEQALIKLGAITGRRVLRAAMLSAVEPMVEAARVNAVAVARSGALALAMGARFQLETAYRGWRLGDAVSAAKVLVGPITGDRAARAVYTVHYGRARRGQLARGIFHGHFIEFGTRRSKARPFLRPAFDATRELVVQRFAEELRRRIERIKATH